MTDVIPRPDDANSRPSWDLLRHFFSKSTRSGAFVKSGLWAVAELESQLGENWLENAYKHPYGGVPEHIMYSAHSSGAFVRTLELALRLRLLRDIDGMASVRNTLRADLAEGKLRHPELQLEVAALARQHGWSPVVERKVHPNVGAVDVSIKCNKVELHVETFSSLLDKQFREAMAWIDPVRDQLRAMFTKHLVHVGGTIGTRLSSEATQQLLAQVETVAIEVSADHISRTVNYQDCQLVLVSLLSDESKPPFSGPRETTGGWYRTASRLREKSTRARRNGTTWMRLDIHDGLWQFSEWAYWSLEEKIASLSISVRAALAGVDGMHGVVVSSGTAFAQGHFADETKVVAESLGFRRSIEPIRVRETIVVPLVKNVDKEIGAWVEMYQSEAAWLEWALKQVDLPSQADILNTRSTDGRT